MVSEPIRRKFRLIWTNLANSLNPLIFEQTPKGPIMSKTDPGAPLMGGEGSDELAQQPAGSLVLYAKPGEVQAGAAQSVMVNGIAYKIARRVNVPILKFEDGETIAVRIDMPINEEPTIRDVVGTVDGVRKVMQEEGFINICRVTEMYSNEPFNVVLPVMAAGDLRNAYPNHAYVGKTFAMQKAGLVAGKRYKQVNVVEIEPATPSA